MCSSDSAGPDSNGGCSLKVCDNVQHIREILSSEFTVIWVIREIHNLLEAAVIFL